MDFAIQDGASPVRKELFITSIVAYQYGTINVQQGIAFGLYDNAEQANLAAKDKAESLYPTVSNADNRFKKHGIVSSQMPHVWMLETLQSLKGETGKHLFLMSIAVYKYGTINVEHCVDYGLFDSLESAEQAGKDKANEVYPVKDDGNRYKRHSIVAQRVSREWMAEALQALGEAPPTEQ